MAATPAASPTAKFSSNPSVNRSPAMKPASNAATSANKVASVYQQVSPAMPARTSPWTGRRRPAAMDQLITRESKAIQREIKPASPQPGSNPRGET